jgi:hypothetical protein
MNAAHVPLPYERESLGEGVSKVAASLVAPSLSGGEELEW